MWSVEIQCHKIRVTTRVTTVQHGYHSDELDSAVKVYFLLIAMWGHFHATLNAIAYP